MYVARDKDGQLWLFTYKPRQSVTTWHYDEGDDAYGDMMELNPELYPNVTFSSGPLEVVLKPVVEESNILETLKNEIEKRIAEKEKSLEEFPLEDYVSSVAATQYNIKVGLGVAKVIIDKCIENYESYKVGQ